MTCTRCDYTTYKAIPETGHSHKADTTHPTCTTAGYTTYTCHCGDTYIDNRVDALGHDEVPHQAQAPTCTTAGYEAYVTCTRCDYTTYKVVPATGHSKVVDQSVAPTCTATGLTQGEHCGVCGETLIAQQIVDATGHSYKSVVTQPDCTNQGYTTHTCAVCQDSYVDAYVDALGSTIE